MTQVFSSPMLILSDPVLPIPDPVPILDRRNRHQRRAAERRAAKDARR